MPEPDSSHVSDAVKDDGGHHDTPSNLKGFAFEHDEVDVAAHVTAGMENDLKSEDAASIRHKIDWYLMPPMCLLYLLQFADKTALGQSAVLGLFDGAHIDQDQFNWLNTTFYIFFFLFQYPQNLALQHFPVAKWMSANILLWSIVLVCHAACNNFGGLLVCRALLGICEGVVTPGFMIVTSMFYTRQEQIQRTGYWFLMNGFAIIMLGLVAFGALHISEGFMAPWQWLMIIFGTTTLVVSTLFRFWFPDSPATAWFLTPKERCLAVQRIAVNQAGLENKYWKRRQMIECLTDPKTWFFFFISTISNVTNSLSNQRQIIVKGFGFDEKGTILFGCIDGLIEAIAVVCTVTAATYWRSGRAYSAVLAYAVAILGSILVNVLPNEKFSLLFSYWMSIFSIAPFPVMLAWVGAVTAGHTKRISTNAIMMMGYALGNTVGSQYWKAKYQPRNHIPWAILAACWFTTAVLIMMLRAYLASENIKRSKEPRNLIHDNIFLNVPDGHGNTISKKVDKAFLDLTDAENKDFIYVL